MNCLFGGHHSTHDSCAVKSLKDVQQPRVEPQILPSLGAVDGLNVYVICYPPLKPHVLKSNPER